MEVKYQSGGTAETISHAYTAKWYIHVGDLFNIYTTVFRIKRLNNRARLTLKAVIKMMCNIKPCNIVSRALIIARISESNKTTAQI
jgi:hypothetical protein